MCLDSQDVFGSQQLGNLHGAFSRNAQVENTLDDLGSFLVHNPLLFVRWVFHIPVGRVGAEVFPSVSFGTHDGTDFLAGITRVEIVEQIAKRGKIVVPLVAVHTVIDGDISNITFRKETLGIVAPFQVIPSHAGHIFDNNGLDFPRFCKAYHLIPTGSIESYTGNAVINEKCGIGKMIVRCVFEQDFLLIGNAVALAVQRILLGQAGV